MKLRFALLGFLVLAAASVLAQVQPSFGLPSFDESKAEFTALPAQIFQANGKYPDSNVILFLNGCDTRSGTTGKHLDAPSYTLSFSGSGLTYSNIQPDTCTIAFDLKGISIPPGVVVATVTGGQTPLGHAFLHFADPHAGPTPAGIQAVDVLWGMISYRVCSDAFGRSVAKKFYCIGLKIGNNSGYSLQLAGVGFNTKYDYQNNSTTTDECSTHNPTNYCTKTPASSYALTRAVSQSGSGDWQYITSDSIKALGLVMVGFAPYYHSALGSARYGTANAIVSGPLQKAWDLLFPDQRQQHSNNLDDQALREGKLIPNNSQVSTVVFLDRGSVTLNYKPGCDAMFASYGVTKGNALEPDSVTDVKKVLENWQNDSVQQIESEISGVTPPQQPARGKKSRGGHDKAAKSPDYVAPADQYIDCVNGRTSSGVKAALGDLIVVGDKIQYLERIVVDQSTHTDSTPTAAAPTITTQPKITSPDAGKTLTLLLEGTDLDKLGDTLTVDVGAPLKRRPGNKPTKAVYDVTPDQAKKGFTIDSSQDKTELKLGMNVTLTVVPWDPSATITAQPIVTSADEGKTYVLTLEGSDLDKLGDMLAVDVDPPLKRQPGNKATKAIYDVTPDQAKKGFTISSTQGSIELKSGKNVTLKVGAWVTPPLPTITAQPNVTSPDQGKTYVLTLEGSDLDKLGDTLVVDIGAPLKRKQESTAAKAIYDVTPDQARKGFKINKIQGKTDLNYDGKKVALKIAPFKKP